MERLDYHRKLQELTTGVITFNLPGVRALIASWVQEYGITPYIEGVIAATYRSDDDLTHALHEWRAYCNSTAPGGERASSRIWIDADDHRDDPDFVIETGKYIF